MRQVANSEKAKGTTKNSAVPAKEAPTEESRQEAVAELRSHLKSIDKMERSDEDLRRFLLENWRNMAWGFAAVLVVVWAINFVQSNREHVAGEASAQFSAAQERFAMVLGGKSGGENSSAAAAADPKAQLRAFEDTLSSLSEEYRRTNYAKLAPLYLAAEQVAKGEPAKALESLKGVDTARFEQAGDITPSVKVGPSEFVEELAALLKARATMDEQPDRGKVLMKALVSRGQFTNVEALLSLQRAASSPEEESAVRGLAKVLMTARPELGALLKNGAAEQGIEL